MKKYKYLFKNIGLMTISNFGSKILSFLLVPLYTSLLTTSEYGTYDLYVTTVSLMTPLLTLSIISGVMRFTLDKETNNSETFSVGLAGSIKATLIFAVIVVLNYFLKIIPTFNEYPVYFVLFFASTNLYNLVSSFTRGLEKVADYAVAGIINSVVMLSLNILFLVVFHMGLSGYFLANCLSKIIPSIYLCLRIHISKYIKLSSQNKKLKKEMLAYSKPLIFNSIAWWINNVSDRYIITWLCGTSANGIYSVAYKIPTIINVFQSIFSEAWTLSAVKEYEEDDGSFYVEIYNLYNFGLVFVCSALIILDRVFAKILFAKDFFKAWEYAPFLMISVVFGALSGLIGGIFSATKDSKAFARTTVIGASVNTILNIVLVHFLGPVGAAIATLISYFIVWLARVKNVQKTVSFNINMKKDIIAYLLLLAQAVIMVVIKMAVLKYAILVVILGIIVVLYLKETKEYLLKIKGVAQKFISKSKDRK